MTESQQAFAQFKKSEDYERVQKGRMVFPYDDELFDVALSLVFGSGFVAGVGSSHKESMHILDQFALKAEGMLS